MPGKIAQTFIDDLRLQAGIVQVIQEYVPLKRAGRTYKGLCPFHNDTKQSLQVNQPKQIFKCFACDAGGDLFDWFKLLGLDYRQELGIQDQPKQSKSERPIHTATWTYHTIDGQPWCEVHRYDYPSGGKEVKPWANGAYKIPVGARPLYNLPVITQSDDILVVEGEKAAEAAKLINPATTTWIGGASSMAKTDWTPLAGKRVTLWPDNDDPGRKAMKQIAGILTELKCHVSQIVWPEGTPPKYDAADHPYTAEWLEQHAQPIDVPPPFVQLGFINESGLKIGRAHV